MPLPWLECAPLRDLLTIHSVRMAYVRVDGVVVGGVGGAPSERLDEGTIRAWCATRGLLGAAPPLEAVRKVLMQGARFDEATADAMVAVWLLRQDAEFRWSDDDE